MEILFIKLLNMSITASWLILAVVFIRLFLKRVPKALRGVLWAMVGIRLLCPFSLESVFSLIPSAETVPQKILYADKPEIHSGISSFNTYVNPVITQAFAPDLLTSVNPLQVVTFIFSGIWIIGMAVMFIYAIASYIRIRNKVREAAEIKEGIWICDRISTPFILGIFRPRIFLSSSMDESDMDYVIAHENAHLKRRDNWWKPLGFILLSVHWFNPVMWVAYILLCRDIEYACDEKVIRENGAEIKKPYSDALINCSVSQRIVAACPLAFGEVGVKARIKAVLNYKKPASWAIITAIIISVSVSACFLTNPISEEEESTGYAQSGFSFDRSDYDTVYYSGPYDRISIFSKASLHLNTEEKSFYLRLSPISSYLPFGDYEYQNDGSVLVLKTGDGLYTYTFKVSGYELIYDDEKSNGITYDSFKDGDIFYEQTFTQAYYDAYGSIDADIDDDGVIEHCSMGYGATSGLFTFTFSASVNGEGKYFTIFNTDFYLLSFVETVGKVQVCGETQEGIKHYFDISVEDGIVVLSEDGTPLGHWGAKALR